MPTLTGEQRKQRSKRRFLIEQDVHYERLRGTEVVDAGKGKTLNMSSNSVRFTTGLALRAGDKVKVALNWPVLLDATCRLKMVIYGSVVRSDGDSATVRIRQHELRTRAGAAVRDESAK
jgi:hypothetical protein